MIHRKDANVMWLTPKDTVPPGKMTDVSLSDFSREAISKMKEAEVILFKSPVSPSIILYTRY